MWKYSAYLLAIFVLFTSHGRVVEGAVTQEDLLLPTCPEDEILVQKKGIQPISDGCFDPKRININQMDDQTYCCDLHSACYSTCGAPKDMCEKELRKCMVNMCKKNYPEKKDCKGDAEMYFIAATVMYETRYEHMQHEYCECIPRGQEVQHYTELVDDFYMKFTQPKDRKFPAEKLVSDVQEKNSPLWELFLNLHKKYDYAIAHTPKRKRLGDAPRPLKVSQKPAPESSSEGSSDGSASPSSQESQQKTAKQNEEL
jgi:hypothetical protein